MRAPLCLCLGLVLVGVNRADADILEVADSSGCLDIPALRSRVLAALDAHGAERGVSIRRISIAASSQGDRGATISVAVVALGGEQLLSRTYHVERHQCASAAALVAVVVERFFSAFPRDRERAPRLRRDAPRSPLASGPPQTGLRRSTRTLRVLLQAAVSSQFLPVGADGELGVRLELGAGRHRFALGASWWGGIPRRIGAGSFWQMAVSGAAAWHFAWRAWLPGLELRAGALRLAGQGFETSADGWLPWLEAVVCLERQLRRFSVGLQLAVALLRHQAITGTGGDSKETQALRLGLRVSYAPWEKLF